MSTPENDIKSVPRAVSASPANGEQDQGVSFKGEGRDVKSPELEDTASAKLPSDNALRHESLRNIGQRRRSSASNQPSVNLRKAQGYSKDNEMARNVGA